MGLEECIPDNEKPCGPGTQVPVVVCVNSDGKMLFPTPTRVKMLKCNPKGWQFLLLSAFSVLKIKLSGIETNVL